MHLKLTRNAVAIEQNGHSKLGGKIENKKCRKKQKQNKKYWNPQKSFTALIKMSKEGNKIINNKINYTGNELYCLFRK